MLGMSVKFEVIKNLARLLIMGFNVLEQAVHAARFNIHVNRQIILGGSVAVDGCAGLDRISER